MFGSWMKFKEFSKQRQILRFLQTSLFFLIFLN